MPERIYTSILFIICFLPLKMSAQEVLFQFGSEESENWDAVSCRNNDCLFAIGFKRSTEINGEVYNAIDRGVVLGRIENERLFIIGQLSSSANTQVSFIHHYQEGYILSGNAFSYLTYRGDTVFHDPGVNKSFLLKLGPDGSFLSISILEAKASAQCVAGWTDDHTIYGLFSINDTVVIDTHVFVPTAETAALIVQWDDQLEAEGGFLLEGTGNIEAVALEGDSSSIYIAGNFRGSIQFGQDSIFTRTADDDGFLAKWDRRQHMPEFLNHLAGVYQDNVKSLAVGESQVFVGGQFIGAIEFGDLQVISGLSVAGFIGAFYKNGDALWLKGVFGNSDLLSIDHITLSGQEVIFSALTGRQIIYEQDTLTFDWELGEIHSLVGRLESNGSLREWRPLEGDPIALVSELVTVEDELKMAIAFTGSFNGFRSEGSYDLLWLEGMYSNTSKKRLQIFNPYPNPTHETLYFNEQYLGRPYHILDQAGQLVFAGQINGQSIYLGFLSAGTYILWVDGPRPSVAKFQKI